jgi:hypothetical protein
MTCWLAGAGRFSSARKAVRTAIAASGARIATDVGIKVTG